MNLLLCNGFNYYNRIIKRYDEYTDYLQFMDEKAPILENINFNPNDGIATTQLINWNYKTPDYIVCVDKNNQIDSRWYVIDATRTRAGQLQLQLYRDVIVDYYDKYKDSPMYVEKATVNSVEDVAIYNQEDISFNSIKKEESLLKDSTGVSWLVGYLSTKLNFGDQNELEINTPTSSMSLAGNFATVNDFYNAIGYNGTRYRELIYLTGYYHVLFGTTIFDRHKYKFLMSDGSFEEITDSSWGTGIKVNYTNNETNKRAFSKVIKQIRKTVEQYFLSVDNSMSWNRFPMNTWNNKYVKIGNDIKRIIITKSEEIASLNNSYYYNTGAGSTYVQNVVNKFNEVFSNVSYENGQVAITNDFYYIEYTVTLESVTNDIYNTKITKTSRILKDAPYKMFMIPFGNVTVKNSSETFNTIGDKNELLCITSTMATELGSNLFDIQLLPYFSEINNIKYWYDSKIDVTQLTEHIDYEYIYQNSAKKSIILYASNSKFSFDISKSLTLPTSIIDRKVVNQCDKYRLCSPNYASMFDFNLLKTGSITKFNVDCTYKPISPYIHINPVWGELYGEDYDDTRGLICQGEFSLPIINDSWIAYQMNNKNYLNSFNRQIDSVELQNKYAKIQDITNAVVGTAGGAVSGYTMSGGNAAGAIAGAAISAVGGAMDVTINEKLRNEALDLTKDQFGYSLDNIQSLQNTLSRVSSFDYNNKIFPILEYYSCTDQEKEIFKNKMLYNGMTIMRVDKLSNFIENDKQYFKAKLIRCEALEEATHEFNTLANELNKGVYI